MRINLKAHAVPVYSDGAFYKIRSFFGSSCIQHSKNDFFFIIIIIIIIIIKSHDTTPRTVDWKVTHGAEHALIVLSSRFRRHLSLKVTSRCLVGPRRAVGNKYGTRALVCFALTAGDSLMKVVITCWKGPVSFAIANPCKSNLSSSLQIFLAKDQCNVRW